MANKENEAQGIEGDLTQLIRDADQAFETVGGSTRHYVRDCLIPLMEERGFSFVKIDEHDPFIKKHLDVIKGKTELYKLQSALTASQNEVERLKAENKKLKNENEELRRDLLEQGGNL